ncbi:MAG: excinuclease ABC subunit A [endosymbiont of Galathealinum brachiosum]|uniref:UvrABC system protein A n=1 Tax=endosymbiont of Galathealinum brachiosum TaxID=2200906 RepID=A0A370DID0_9GAMM|nr:MAG: excinuclease ABC subunit A [endosymbiont of Galathealinum brachiosum]
MSKESIIVKGARQNNLKNLDLELPTNELIVVTGVSGSGKSTLAFDTIYAEGQRRYVETFSAYARQFLDRMDKPSVDSIQGIPPAIAIDQTNPVRTSRSTVGTMTELNDYLKLLFARMAQLYCSGCGREVLCDSSQSIVESLYAVMADNQRVMVCLPVKIPHNFTEDEIVGLLNQQGYTRIHKRDGSLLEVIQDRFKLNEENKGRLTEAVEASLNHANGRVHVFPLDENKKAGKALRFSSHHHCPDCDIDYGEPSPSLFSFNSPIGACESCKGFGRIIGVDYGLVIPDESKSLKEGAVKPIQTPSYIEVQDELIKFAKKSKIPIDIPWKKLTKKQQRWVIEGEGDWDDGVWFGIQRFFKWLESKSYKMHIRVLLSKYRSYTPCGTCDGARLKAPALWWRLGSLELSNKVIDVNRRLTPKGLNLSKKDIEKLPGLTVHDVMHLPLSDCAEFFKLIKLPSAIDEAAQLLLSEVRSRLNYLLEVGLGYLTLDRQSRTLSGGEVQRINLTTALGTSLVNTLFVLDEPSIGLHPRDVNRLVTVLHRLRDAGNSLLVVEHDPQVMLAADRILDIGPGPGRLGGEICFYGSPKQLLRNKKSLTAQYLSGKKSVSKPAEKTAGENEKQLQNQVIQIIGASEHNLKNIDVDIPLHQLVCITGVSGSGKSTLMRDVLYPWLCKHKGKTVETPGVCKKVKGHQLVDDVVLVDQSPIGKTTRSIPATYVGAFDAIRKLFIAEPLSKERKYTPGTFSFNSGNGRCPTCSGNGFEMVEMQFLSDVYIRCPDCDGKRYRAEILQVKLFGEIVEGDRQAKSIADILAMTVAEALLFFADEPEVIKTLQPLVDVGLHYVQLGQSVPTLSGGESQRLKLAGHLAKNLNKKKQTGKKSKLKKTVKGTLFLFDEPTTGLHFDDISTLMKAFQQLIDAGNSLLVIEHNLDVIRSADWLIDIGPEGGDGGGQLVTQGYPQQIAVQGDSYTSVALREYEASFNLSKTELIKALPVNTRETKVNQSIQIHHARENNLKNVDIEIPRNKFTVISGVSGSGKSTVAFDIVFGEGQRRYLESLNAYARQFVQPASRPDVDAIHGIPPTVAIEQRTSRGGRKSTVATLTEIYHFMRLLYVKLGTQYCPECEVAIEPQSLDAILAMVQKDYRGREVTLLAPMVVARKGIYNELAKWASTKGYQQLRVDGEYVSTSDWPKLARYKEHDIELPIGKLKIAANKEKECADLLQQALDVGNGIVIVEPLKATKKQVGERLFSTERACPSCGKGFDELDPRLFSYNSKHGWCDSCYGTGETIKDFDEEQTGEEGAWLENEDDVSTQCKTCDGQRLNETALAVRFRKMSIAQLAAMSVDDSEKWFSKLKLTQKEQIIARDLLQEMSGRLSFLQRVGLNYLTLDRSAPTLSGGEAQRIRLASQLGSNLQGVCYILDEPTIGLHARDNQRLIKTLRQIQQQGNTVLVVEHDEDTIREADYLIDMGPGAGIEGGEVVAHGTLKQMIKNKKSLTGQFISSPLRHPMNDLRDNEKRSLLEAEKIKIVGAVQNNLTNIEVVIPLRKLVSVSGVSGSGKSTLIRSVLHGNLKTAINNQRSKAGRNKKISWQGCKEIKGWESIQRILEVDQTPIGKTPRSCPATYIGIWDTIRKLFSDTVDARLKGFKPGRFSFNAGDGRCDACGGHGMRKVEMNFLPDVRVECEVCHGWRFNDETLSVRYKDKHIGEVLGMNVKTATEYFSAIPKLHHALQLLQDVGLGYLTLGQQSPTLSGGEAQRIKLVAELAKANTSPTAKIRQHNLYILDEPTVGLHMADVEKLLRVLHRLVDAGNSVIVIEHNLDVIAESDWVIDMGPEGGKYGGKVVAQGKPEIICKRKKSHTGVYLKELIN